METKVDALIDQKVPAVLASGGWRRALLPVALLLSLSLADRGGRAAANTGIDPLDVLDLTVKNNILFVLDTSGSMTSTPDDVNLNYDVTDDPTSRIFQAKDAIRQVVASQDGKVNFGIATFNILNATKQIASNGPMVYVSADQYAQDWSYSGGFFNGLSNTFGNYNRVDDSAETYASFGANVFPIANTYGGYPGGCVAQNGPLSGGKILAPIDLATPASMRCRYWLRSQLYRNNTLYRWNRGANATGMVSRTAITCPLPPAGLVGYNPDADGDGLADNPVPCIQFQDNTTPTRIATFYYAGINFTNTSGNNCGGAGLISSVSTCDDPLGTQNAAVVAAINNAMDLAVPVTSGKLTLKTTGLGSGLGGMEVTAAMTGSLGTEFQVVGVRPPDKGVSATQSTPIGTALDNVRTWATAHPAGGTGMFPPRPAAAVGLQKNFVIVVTDGDDTCGGSVPAAQLASNLFYNTKPGTIPTNWNAEPTDPQHQATSFVIAFGTGIAPDNANVIAQGGSGAVIDTSQPAATAATCPAGASCRDAFLASNTAQLVDALNQAIALAASTGTFAASPGVVDNVFEYGKFVSATPGTFDPLDPNTRFKTTAPVLVQPTFALPGFKGHLTAFSNKGLAPSCPPGATEPVTGTCQLWDAGQKLYDRITKTPTGAACASGNTNCMVPLTGEYNFASLMGTATLGTAGTATDLRIRRRIFTTGGNGVNLALLPLWPPTTNGTSISCTTDAACQAAGNEVAPRSGTLNPLGALDVALGIAGMDFNGLKTEFLACTGTPLPAACGDGTGIAPNTVQVRRAKLEAREIILAATAGAEPVLLAGALKRDASGWPLFKARSWMLAESSYASPAIVTRSPDKPTDNEKQEWVLYRDGVRSQATGQAINAINLGFGNRNPDKDSTVASQADLTLKPVMTFILYPANDMLHAFRAGPCPVVSPAPDCNGELGGDEMWGFVPFDQLGKLAPARKIQNRTTKVYMMASSIRFGDVFIKSSPFTIQGISYNGRWKKMAYFGRGLGGKYYTGLDLTLNGPFTSHSLKTALPSVSWNRGNPDTDDGLCKSGLVGCSTLSNSYANAIAGGGALDYTAYLGMGESWSTPAMARVDPLFNGTARTPVAAGTGGVSFALYMGSGFTDTPTEGSTFYGVDALTGDVINSKDVGDNITAASGVPPTLNVLAADAAAFAPNLLVAGSSLPNPANEITTRVFIGDTHGRLWKFNTDDPGFTTTSLAFADLGADQPIGVAVGLLNYDSTGTDGVKPHVYAVTGADARVNVPPAFRMYGFKEESTGLATLLSGFPVDLPPDPLPGYRGSVQPSTAFNVNSLGRVFFTGTRFNPPGANCVSTFSSIIFALTAGTATAAYDLSASGDDRFVEITGKIITPPNTSTGEPEVVTGDRISAPPAPPPPPKQVGGLGNMVSVTGDRGPAGSPLYRMVSGVCN